MSRFHFLLFSILFILLTSCDVLGIFTQFSRQDTPQSPTPSLYQNTLALTTKKDTLLSFLPQETEFLSYKEDSTIFSARVPQGRPFDAIVVSFLAKLIHAGYTIEDAFHNTRRGRATLNVQTPQQDSLKIRIIQGVTYFSNCGNVALIVRNIDKLDAATRLKFLTSDVPFNYTLPAWINNRDSTIAILGRYGNDVILQMPLESRINRLTKKTDYTIYMDDKIKIMRKRVGALVELQPSVVGLSVYGGDLVLNSESATTAFMNVLKQFNLIYFETLKAPNNIARSITDKTDTPYIRVCYNLTTKSADNLNSELRHFALVATKRKAVYLSVDASLELLEALALSKDYFASIGISFATINSLQD